MHIAQYEDYILHVCMLLFPSCRMKPPECPTLWMRRFILIASWSFATTTRKNHCLDIVLNYAGDGWISSAEL